MRFVGLVLVVLGALGLGYQGFTQVTTEKVADAGSVQGSRDKENAVRVSPAGGIALVSGLILLATGGRKDG